MLQKAAGLINEIKVCSHSLAGCPAVRCELMEAVISAGQSPTIGPNSGELLKLRAERIATLKKRLDEIRLLTRKRFQQGASGLQTSSALSQLMDDFVISVFDESSGLSLIHI